MKKNKRLLFQTLYFIFRMKYKANILRTYFYSNIFKKCGKNLKVYGKFSVIDPESLSLGSNISINDNVYINAAGYIEIGNNVALSANCMLISTGLKPDIFFQGKNSQHKHYYNNITIGNNVQIGAGAIVLPGVKIGDNVIIGAGAIVTKNILGNCIVAGVPARIIRKLERLEKKHTATHTTED